MSRGNLGVILFYIPSIRANTLSIKTIHEQGEAVLTLEGEVPPKPRVDRRPFAFGFIERDTLYEGVDAPYSKIQGLPPIPVHLSRIWCISWLKNPHRHLYL
jgi:hypothetical protein